MSTTEDDDSRMSIGSGLSGFIDQAQKDSVNKSDEEEIIMKPSLEEVCQRRPYLDGIWFSPDLPKSTLQSISAACQLCNELHNKKTMICGAANAISNFKAHIKVRKLQ